MKQHEGLNRYVNGQMQRGNVVAFPEKEFETCVVMERGEDKMKAREFVVYEIFGERNKRRVRREGEAFDVDMEGRVVAYSNDKGEIVMQSIRIPEAL